MSVSQKANAPRVPDWDAEEIIEAVRQRYGKPQEMYDELDMNASEIVNWAYSLEPDEEDLDKQIEFLELVEELEEEYESSHWVDEDPDPVNADADYKRIFNGVLRDPENNEAWIMITETEYETEE